MKKCNFHCVKLKSVQNFKNDICLFGTNTLNWNWYERNILCIYTTKREHIHDYNEWILCLKCWRYGVKSVYAYVYIFDLLKNISNTRKRCVCWCNSFGRTIWVKIKLISLCKVLVFILVLPKFQPMCLALSIKCTC